MLHGMAREWPGCAFRDFKAAADLGGSQCGAIKSNLLAYLLSIKNQPVYRSEAQSHSYAIALSLSLDHQTSQRAIVARYRRS